jgi:hypothetical protein
MTRKDDDEDQYKCTYAQCYMHIVYYIILYEHGCIKIIMDVCVGVCMHIQHISRGIWLKRKHFLFVFVRYLILISAVTLTTWPAFFRVCLSPSRKMLSKNIKLRPYPSKSFHVNYLFSSYGTLYCVSYCQHHKINRINPNQRSLWNALDHFAGTNFCRYEHRDPRRRSNYSY